MALLSLKPAQSLLHGLTRQELLAFARRNRLVLPAAATKRSLIAALTTHLDIDELAESLLRFFPRRRLPGRARKSTETRLDRAARMAGPVTVQVYSRSSPGLGRLLLAHARRCLLLRTGNVPLFLENRWPVTVHDGGTVPSRLLYAAFVGRGRVHPSAGAPPPVDRPFMLDQGEYGIRNGRLRLELERAGPVSFRVRLLRFRPPAGRPEYLLLPIA